MQREFEARGWGLEWGLFSEAVRQLLRRPVKVLKCLVVDEQGFYPRHFCTTIRQIHITGQSIFAALFLDISTDNFPGLVVVPGCSFIR